MNRTLHRNLLLLSYIKTPGTFRAAIFMSKSHQVKTCTVNLQAVASVHFEDREPTISDATKLHKFLYRV